MAELTPQEGQETEKEREEFKARDGKILPVEPEKVGPVEKMRMLGYPESYKLDGDVAEAALQAIRDNKLKIADLKYSYRRKNDGAKVEGFQNNPALRKKLEAMGYLGIGGVEAAESEQIEQLELQVQRQGTTIQQMTEEIQRLRQELSEAAPTPKPEPAPTPEEFTGETIDQLHQKLADIEGQLVESPDDTQLRTEKRNLQTEIGRRLTDLSIEADDWPEGVADAQTWLNLIMSSNDPTDMFIPRDGQIWQEEWPRTVNELRENPDALQVLKENIGQTIAEFEQEAKDNPSVEGVTEYLKDEAERLFEEIEEEETPTPVERVEEETRRFILLRPFGFAARILGGMTRRVIPFRKGKDISELTERELQEEQLKELRKTRGRATIAAGVAGLTLAAVLAPEQAQEATKFVGDQLQLIEQTARAGIQHVPYLEQFSQHFDTLQTSAAFQRASQLWPNIDLKSITIPKDFLQTDLLHYPPGGVGEASPGAAKWLSEFETAAASIPGRVIDFAEKSSHYEALKTTTREFRELLLQKGLNIESLKEGFIKHGFDSIWHQFGFMRDLINKGIIEPGSKIAEWLVKMSEVGLDDLGMPKEDARKIVSQAVGSR